MIVTITVMNCECARSPIRKWSGGTENLGTKLYNLYLKVKFRFDFCPGKKTLDGGQKPKYTVSQFYKLKKDTI